MKQGEEVDDIEIERINNYDKDPLLHLGYGVNSYFQIIMRMVAAMLLLTVFFAGVMWGYATQGDPLSGLARVSLGSVGASSVLC